MTETRYQRTKRRRERRDRIREYAMSVRQRDANGSMIALGEEELNERGMPFQRYLRHPQIHYCPTCGYVTIPFPSGEFHPYWGALQTYLCPLCDLVELLDLAAKIEATIADELGHIVRPKPRSRVMVG